MKKNNRLSLKALKQELELIKSTKGINTSPSNVENINIFKRSSMFYLWLISGILGYASKIPLVGRVISLLSLWYGRTTFWVILIKIRKMFVIFNALIGVYMVYKTVGFNSDNVFAGIGAMGHSYLEILFNFTKRMFNWFVELFDHKIIPNVPNNNPKPYFWSPRGIESGWQYNLPKLDKIPSEWVTNPFNITTSAYTPWYKEWSTWLLIVGIIGVGFLGYKFIIDPLFIENLNNTPTTPKAPTNIVDDIVEDITLGGRISEGFANVTKSIGNGISKIRYNLNPFNWLLATDAANVNAQYQDFINKQNDLVTADRRFYPFTPDNPFLPWYKKVKLYFIGESFDESLQRIKDQSIAERIYNSLAVSKGKYTSVGGLTPYTTAGDVTPNAWVGNVGLTTPIPSLTFADHIHNINIENRFNTLTPTPTIIPTVSEKVLTDVGGSLAEWNSHERAPHVEDFVKNWKSGNIPSSSKVTLDDIPVHKNKFSVLDEEII